MIKRKDIVIVGLITLLNFNSSFQAQQCTLNDPGRTPGECVDIRKCTYQIARLRVEASVSTCGGSREIVCCPTEETISEKMCSKWRSMLHAPMTFDQARLKEPLCAATGYLQFIVNGRDAKPFEYPHAVALGYGSDQNKLKFLCGATLVSERHLLTAAHCITTRNIGRPSFAILGDNTLDPKKADPDRPYLSTSYRKVRRIGKITVHPEYKPPLIYNDIAIIELSQPLELDRFILPACIGTPKTNPGKNKEVEASGWGITDPTSSSTSNYLQSINITTVDGKTCNQIYGLDADKGFRYPDGIIKKQICATGENKDTCRGDSGGGLYRREYPCIFHLVGITSIGRKVCGFGDPAVYTTVASYQDWIESNIWGGGSGNRG